MCLCSLCPYIPCPTGFPDSSLENAASVHSNSRIPVSTDRKGGFIPLGGGFTPLEGGGGGSYHGEAS